MWILGPWANRKPNMSPSLRTGPPTPHCNYNGEIRQTWDLIITTTTICKIFSGIPRSTIFNALKYAPKIPWCIWAHIWARNLARIWARQIWSSGVFLNRSCKMQLRYLDLRSIWPNSQKLRPYLDFARFPHFNYDGGVGGPLLREGDMFGKEAFSDIGTGNINNSSDKKQILTKC